MLTKRGCCVSIAATIGCLAITQCGKKEEDTSGAGPNSAANQSEEILVVPDFHLTTQDERDFSLNDLRGKVWVANFIFTRCPTTCPEMTTAMAKIQNANAAADLRFASFTVDPSFDSPSVLRSFAEQHGAKSDRWKFLTGSRLKLWRLSKDGFQLPVSENPDREDGRFTHSSRFVLVDRGTRIRSWFELDQMEELTTMLAEVLAEDPPVHGAVPLEVVGELPEALAPTWLEARATQQIAAKDKIKVDHNFRFTDRMFGSGITFEHEIVDDAGRDHKPNHYDHGNGVAAADVDGDGLLDLYFSTQLGSNQLWRNAGGGKFTEITTPEIALADRVGVTASFADTDNDGDPDLFVTTVRGGNRLFINDGTGTFSDATDESGLAYSGHSSAGVFFDYDRDGLVDLFLCNVGVYTTDKIGRGGYYVGHEDAFGGHLKEWRSERSTLYRNTGQNRFVDVSEATGLLDHSWTGDATPIDGNEDGWPDLYVVSMQGNDEYYENIEGKRFEKKSRSLFPKTPWGSMGVKSFDYDNDGHQDLFITDMHSDMSAGAGPDQEKRKSIMNWPEQFLITEGASLFGNAFFLNVKGKSFLEISQGNGAENYWPWGLSTGDLNADGYEDVFIASSMNYPFRYGINSVLLNDEGKVFRDAEFILGVEPRRGGRTAKYWFTLADPAGADAQHKLVVEKKVSKPSEVWAAVGSRSSVIFDLDADGDLDIVTNEFNDRPMLLISDLAQRRAINWLGVNLVGNKSNRAGLGAQVRVFAGEKILTKVHDGQSGYLSQSAMPLYFGLGAARSIEKVEVRWPSGTAQIIETPQIGKNITIREE